MTPKDKAIELVNKFIFIDDGSKFQFITIEDEKKAISCALIAVDEIIKALRKDLPEIGKGKGYWYRVRQEIENI